MQVTGGFVGEGVGDGDLVGEGVGDFVGEGVGVFVLYHWALTFDAGTHGAGVHVGGLGVGVFEVPVWALYGSTHGGGVGVRSSQRSPPRLLYSSRSSASASIVSRSRLASAAFTWAITWPDVNG